MKLYKYIILADPINQTVFQGFNSIVKSGSLLAGQLTVLFPGAEGALLTPSSSWNVH